jgi:hypothetical protein
MSSCAVLHQRQDQAQRGHRKPRRQRPRAALPVSSCLKHGAHRWRSLNKFVLHLNLRHPVFPKLFSGKLVEHGILSPLGGHRHRALEWR